MGINFLSFRCQVTTLGKLFTQKCLCQTASKQYRVMGGDKIGVEMTTEIRRPHHLVDSVDLG